MTFQQISDRLVYTALNLGQTSLPWGNISAVFNWSFVKPMTAIAPFDTGAWHGSCIGQTCLQSLPPNIAREFPETSPTRTSTCASWWPPIPGTYDHAAHLLNFSFFALGSTQIQSILCPHGFVSEAALNGPGPYYEANILGTAKYPEALKMVIADFATLFGSERGKTLRTYCQANGWVLAWTHPTVTRQQRMLDAAVVVPNTTAARNLTDADRVSSLQYVSQLWEAVAGNRSLKFPSVTQWDRWWGHWEEASPSMFVDMVKVYDCADVDQCVGVLPHYNNSCVCYE